MAIIDDFRWTSSARSAEFTAENLQRTIEIMEASAREQQARLGNYSNPINNVKPPMDISKYTAFKSDDKKPGAEAVGEKFVIVSAGSGGNRQTELDSLVGQTVTLIEVDGSATAYFKTEGDNTLWIYWTNVAPEKQKSPIVPITRASLDRITISDDVKDEIVSVMKQHERRDVLLNDWGLGDVIEYGLGMVMLFWGPPGVGKTFTAKKVAEALGLKLTVVTNAELQSSQPGQMERNVKALFEKAKRTKEVLLFDECDGMVQSRDGMGQIMSSENNCLLTEIEKHDGIVFLTTNRVDTLDAALERRVSLIIEFKSPTQDERTAIWALHLPEKLPLAKDVDKAKLSEWNLSGGQIKNCVLNAARFALGDDKDEVSMAHFDKAVKRCLEGSKAFSGRRRTSYNMVHDALQTHSDKTIVRQSDMGVSKRK